MAALAQTQVANSLKALLIGDSGAGKTGALASLAKAGYNLRILDFDRGTEILFHLLKGDPQALARVDVELCLDEFGKHPVLGIVPKIPLKAFSHAMKCLDNWPGLGKPSTWGNDTILVLDSLSFLGEATMRHVLSGANRLGQAPQLQDWGAAMGLQEDVLALLYSDAIKCNVIVTSHVKFVQQEGDPVSLGYPNALGKKLPPVIGRYFNSTLLAEAKKVGGVEKRVLRTKSAGMIKCKTSAPGHVQDEYPVETGLADYFKDLLGPIQKSEPKALTVEVKGG